MAPLIVVYVAIIILCIAAMWTLFNKAGQPGWACIIPIYNLIVFFRVIGKPWWWLFLWMIPYINIIWVIWSLNLLSKSFGKSEGFTVGLVFLGFIFLPILAFGDNKYAGPAGKKK